MSDRIGDLTFAEVANALGTITSKLDDPNLQTRILNASVSGDISLLDDDLTLESSGTAKIFAFNDNGDKDPSGIFGEAEEGEQDTENIPPLLRLQDGEAILKYQVGGKYAVGGTLSNIDFKVGVDGGVELMAYRLHNGSENVLDAVKADLSGERFLKPYDVEDLQKLRIGEALAIEVNGALSAGVEVSWSQVLASGINTFAKLIKPGNLASLSFGASLDASFDLELKDVFTLVYSREQAGSLLVSVKKAESSDVEASVGISVKLGFEDGEALAEYLNDAVAALLGEDYARIAEVLEVASFDDLDDRGKALVKSALTRLKLPEETTDVLAGFKKGFLLLRDSAKQVISEIVKFKLGLGFQYDYSRIQSDTVLMQVSIPDGQLATYQHHLLNWNLTPVLNETQKENSELTLKTFFRTQKLKVRNSWGFSLFLGGHTFGGKDTKELEAVITTDRNGDKKISFQGSRGYTESDDVWKVDLKAQMPKFATVPKANDFQLGLALKWEDAHVSGTNGNFRRQVDRGMMWGMISPDHKEQAVRLLEKELGGKSDLTFSLELSMDHDLMMLALPALVVASDSRLALALAESMPYDARFDQRNDPVGRRNTYAGAWKLWLEGVRERERLQNHLRPKLRGAGSLRRIELNDTDAALPNSFLGVAQGHKIVESRYADFKAGASAILQHWQEGEASDGRYIADAFKQMQGFWSQSLYVNGLAVLIRNTVASNELGGSALQRLMKVTYKEGNEEKILTVASS